MVVAWCYYLGMYTMWEADCEVQPSLQTCIHWEDETTLDQDRSINIQCCKVTKYTGMCHNAWLQQHSLQACATLSSSLSRHSSLPPIVSLLIKLRGSFFPSGSPPSPQLHAFSHPLPRTACPPSACCLSLRHVQPLCT